MNPLKEPDIKQSINKALMNSNEKIRINILCTEDLISSRLNYVIAFLNNHPLKPANAEIFLNEKMTADISINYTSLSNDNITIPFQNIFFNSENRNDIDIFVNKYSDEENLLYSVEKITKEQGKFFSEGLFGFDIFETIFFHISRFEEYFSASEQLDCHARMKSEEQLLVKYNLYHIPVVDRLVFSFFSALGFQMTNKASQYSLTHDIDAIFKYNSLAKFPKSVIRVLLMGLGFDGVFRIIKSYVRKIKNYFDDPYYSFDYLFRPETFFIRKIVFFVSGGNTRFDLYNKNYLKNLKKVVDFGLENGYIVGFHPSYNASSNAPLFNKEKKVLENISQQKIEFCRTHFLRLDFKKSFQIMKDDGIRFDSTLGYPDLVGFRCGTGFEYSLYDFANENISDIREIPLVVMDGSSLQFQCNEDSDCFKKDLYEFLLRNKFNTHITFNFHNSIFDDSLKSRVGLIAIYIDLIRDLEKSNF